MKSTDTGYPSLEQHTTILRTLVRNAAHLGGVAFDLGTGPGRIVRMLTEEGFTVYGCELDPQRAVAAQQVQGAKIEVSNVLEWIPPGRADVVTCIELIEHLCLEDQQLLLERIRTWLAPGGVLILSTPQRHSVVSLIERTYSTLVRQQYMWWDHTHVSVLTRHHLEELMHASGFEIVKRVGYHIVPDLFASKLPVLKRLQHLPHGRLLRDLAFDQIYVATVTNPRLK